MYLQLHWQMQESYKPQLKKNYIHVTLNLCWMTHLACFTHMSTQSLQTSHVSQAVHVSKHTLFLRPNKYLIPYHHGGIHINLIYNKEKNCVRSIINTTVDFRLNNQYVIKVQTFSVNSKKFVVVGLSWNYNFRLYTDTWEKAQCHF